MRSSVTRRLYRWIEGPAYLDSAGRPHTLNALLGEETSPAGESTTFAGLTDLLLNRQTVLAVANQGGRLWSIPSRRAASGLQVQARLAPPPSALDGLVRELGRKVINQVLAAIDQGVESFLEEALQIKAPQVAAQLEAEALGYL